MLDTLDYTQLLDSCKKLLHYTLPFTAVDLKLEFYLGTECFGSAEFKAPREILFSSTLYTRIDDCHGAGVCCRIGFDLVYSAFDRSRIVNFDFRAACQTYGEASAQQFLDNQRRLLHALEEVKVVVNGSRSFPLYVLRNRDINKMSGNTSCPFLAMGKDRYWCGVHVFKPLHCWMPHMTIRTTESEERERPSVSIGRNQYGRNHKFGCPVQFMAAKVSIPGQEKVNHDYLKPAGQFDSDVAKLEWVSASAASMGFTAKDSQVAGLPDILRRSKSVIRRLLETGSNEPIKVYERGATYLT